MYEFWWKGDHFVKLFCDSTATGLVVVVNRQWQSSSFIYGSPHSRPTLETSGNLWPVIFVRKHGTVTTTEDFLTAHALLKVTALTVCAAPPFILQLTRCTCLAAVTLAIPFLTHIPLSLLTPHNSSTAVTIQATLVWITAHLITQLARPVLTSCTMTHIETVMNTTVLVFVHPAQ